VRYWSEQVLLCRYQVWLVLRAPLRALRVFHLAVALRRLAVQG
jgi:hypothetical protein